MALDWLWNAAGQVFTTDFWGRMLTRPWEAVIADPALALKSGAVAGGAVLAGGLALKAAPIVLGAIRTAAAPVTFAARHPILTYVALTNADLPTEIVRAFGARQAAGPVPAPVPTTLAQPQAPRAFPVAAPGRGPVTGLAHSQQMQAMFAW